jgi:hypothetical protein
MRFASTFFIYNATNCAGYIYQNMCIHKFRYIQIYFIFCFSKPEDLALKIHTYEEMVFAKVSKIHVHESYEISMTTLINDIALLELDLPVEMTYLLHPACLPSQGL